MTIGVVELAAEASQALRALIERAEGEAAHQPPVGLYPPEGVLDRWAVDLAAHQVDRTPPTGL